MGVHGGVPDLLLWFPNGRAAQVELKVGRQPLSDPQLDWHVTMQRLGHAVYVARSVDDLEAILRTERVPAVGRLQDGPKPPAASTHRKNAGPHSAALQSPGNDIP